MTFFNENVHSVAVSEESVIDFLNFCKKIHTKMECKISGRKMSNFIDPLFDHLKENCSLDEKKEFLFAECYHDRDFFENLFVLSKNREFCFQFLQAFKEEKLAFFVAFAKKYNNLSLVDTKNE